MHGGIFQKVTTSNFLIELLAAEKEIIAAMHFSGSCGTRGAGNGIVSLSVVGQPTTERGFSRAGRARDEKKNASA
jgi:hypothetical protein